MIGYIYKTTNLINNKIYIGKRQKPKFDANYIGSGKKLKSAIKHYGKEYFKCEVLEWCETVEKLNVQEIFWIRQFNSQDELIGYNISNGGEGGDIFHTLPTETQLKRREQQRQNGHKNKGRCRVYKGSEIKNVWPEELESYLANGWVRGLPPEIAKRQGATRTGRKHSAEWVANQQKSQQKRAANLTAEDRKKRAEATRLQMAALTPEERRALALRGVQGRLKKRGDKKVIWVNKDGIKKYIFEEELSSYLTYGWKRGMK